MKKIYLITLFLALFLCHISAESIHLSTQSPNSNPLYETRAVWLTTIGGIDWPHTYANTPAARLVQQRELCDILDRLYDANINTVIIQTRVRATTIFPSDMEPWDGCLSGKPGTAPGYDALAFAIDECHKRGMQVHAWVVTIPVGKWNGAGCRNLRKTCPNLLKKIGDEGFMNPEASGTADYLARFCEDIAMRYDVDGIHLDYIRYPDTWGKIANRDAARENITRIVRTIANKVKSAKPQIQLSCSPVGKYSDTKRQWSHGWNARNVVCQDVALWLRQGYMDAIFPMMYFKDENFYPFAIDWQERSAGKTVAPGLGIYFMHPREKNWPLGDITRELHVLRQYGMGNCMFRSKFFTDNTKGIYSYYSEAFAPYPAIPQSSRVQKYNLFGSDTYPVDVTKAENLLAAGLTTPDVQHGMTEHIRYFAVTDASSGKTVREYGDDSQFTRIVIPSNVISSVVEKPISLHVGRDDTSFNSQLPDGSLVIIATILGNDFTSAIVKGGRINTSNLPAGHYKAYSINKKGHRHLLGTFSIEPHVP
ncbi:MAG: family 10 glycosylhydrolase [Prevotella sp.]|nr:family 10 glycosylhydrolase [Prevotella sp.]